MEEQKMSTKMQKYFYRFKGQEMVRDGIKLKASDLMLLSWFSSAFYGNDSEGSNFDKPVKINYNGHEFFWLNYSYYIEQNQPVFTGNYDSDRMAIYRSIKRLCDSKLISKYEKKIDGNKKQIFLRLTGKCQEYFYHD